MWMGKERIAVTACHWVLSSMCAARVTSYSLSLSLSCVLCLCRFDLNFPRSLALRSSFCLSPFLRAGVSCVPWWLFLSFFLPVSHSPFLLLARSLSHSLTGPLALLFSLPTPPPLHLFLSLPRDCDGPQRPAQMRVISDSILTDSEFGLKFVATLWYNMHLLQGSSSFSLTFFQS